MNHWIVYHQSRPGTDCPDGVMAAAIAERYISSQPDVSGYVQVIGDTYRHRDEYGPAPKVGEYPFHPGDNIWVVDFSYPRQWLEYWQANSIGITIIDHHADKFPMLSGFAASVTGVFTNVVLDETECGATLAWRYFYPHEPLPDILLHVRRRDIALDGYYDGDCPDSELLNEALSLYRHEIRQSFQSEQDGIAAVVERLQALLWHSDQQAVVQGLLDKGLPLIEERNRLVDQACDRAFECQFDEWSVIAAVLQPEEDRVYSLVGNKLARAYPSAAFAWIRTSDGKNHFRSDRKGNDFDVRIPAHLHGGGGHRNAAGY